MTCLRYKIWAIITMELLGYYNDNGNPNPPMQTGLPGNYRNGPFCLEEGDRPRAGYTSTLPWGQISGSYSAEFILDNVPIHDNTTQRHNVYIYNSSLFYSLEDGVLQATVWIVRAPSPTMPRVKRLNRGFSTSYMSSAQQPCGETESQSDGRFDVNLEGVVWGVLQPLYLHNSNPKPCNGEKTYLLSDK